MKRKPSCEWFDSERTTAGVPRDCLFMGLALGELSSLVVEGAYYHARRNTVVEMWKSLDGYKTYIVMWTVVAAIIVEKVMGFDVPGFEMGDDWMNWLLGAFGLGGVRSAMSKM